MSIVSTSVAELLKKTERLFSESSIPSPRLDAEVLLAYLLEVKREWLVAHSDEELSSHIKNEFEVLVEQRLNREPVAYIIGNKEFYGREFIVTPEVLIPRPETEALIDMVKEYVHPGTRVLDVGTGSGCIGITLKLEHPTLNMTLGDISEVALDIARKNAHMLGAKPLRFVISDLLEHWLSHQHPKSFDLIVANLPYVDSTWKRSPETDYEPELALFASDHGLELIKRLIDQCPGLLSCDSYVFLEADPEQHKAIIERATQNGLVIETVRDYILVFKMDR